MTENLSRFAGGLGYGRRSNYLLPVLGDSWPLGMLAAAAVTYALIARSARADGEGRDRLARDAVRVFAIYFLVTVVVLSVAAYKQRHYLAPLWPVSVIMIAWCIERSRDSRIEAWLTRSAFAMCFALVIFNFFLTRSAESLQCSDRDYPRAAEEIKRMIHSRAPLYNRGFSAGINGNLAPLVFYLRRNAPRLAVPLKDAPAGYSIVQIGPVAGDSRLPPPGLRRARYRLVGPR